MPKCLQPLQRVTNGDMSGNITSQVVDGRYLENLCWQLIWTGTPTGAFSLQESLDYNPVTGVGTWLDDGAGITGPTGSSGSAMITLQFRAPRFYRLVYTAGGGAGVLNVWASGSGPR